MELLAGDGALAIVLFSAPFTKMRTVPELSRLTATWYQVLSDTVDAL
jgi:hypothetical protein